MWHCTNSFPPSSLFISDPIDWSTGNVQKWLLWTEHLYRLPHAGKAFQDLTGKDLCAMSEEEFRQRSPQCGDTLHAHLDIWKSGVWDLCTQSCWSWLAAASTMIVFASSFAFWVFNFFVEWIWWMSVRLALLSGGGLYNLNITLLLQKWTSIFSLTFLQSYSKIKCPLFSPLAAWMKERCSVGETKTTGELIVVEVKF